MTLSAFLVSIAKDLELSPDKPKTLTPEQAETLAKACRDQATIALNLEKLENDPSIFVRYAKWTAKPKKK